MFDFKGAIFDLDGTIIDSMNVWEKIDIEFLAKRNINMPNDYMEKINIMSFEEAAKYTIERFNLKEKKENLIKVYDVINDIAGTLDPKKTKSWFLTKKQIKTMKESGKYNFI